LKKKFFYLFAFFFFSSLNEQKKKKETWRLGNRKICDPPSAPPIGSSSRPSVRSRFSLQGDPLGTEIALIWPSSSRLHKSFDQVGRAREFRYLGKSNKATSKDRPETRISPLSQPFSADA
jgi:hypothetical protein